MKARGRRPSAFICFEVFGTRDEALALVFDILHDSMFCRNMSLKLKKNIYLSPLQRHFELIIAAMMSHFVNNLLTIVSSVANKRTAFVKNASRFTLIYDITVNKDMLHLNKESVFTF